MKISIFTTITNPEENQYPYLEAIASYLALADEVVIVDGGGKTPAAFSQDGSWEKIRKLEGSRKIKPVSMPWPETWEWKELPYHLNAGLDACTGDWCIKTDIDYLFHEKDIADIKVKLQAFYDSRAMAASFVKFNILNREKGYQKTIMPLAISKRFRGIIRYGIAKDAETDWCYPILVPPNSTFSDVPVGNKLPDQHILGTGVDVYNYDYFFKTREKAKEDFWSFAQAYATAFDDSWGDTKEKSWEVFTTMMKGRNKSKYLKDVDHPKFIKDRIKRMKPEEFGYNNWDNFKNV